MPASVVNVTTFSAVVMPDDSRVSFSGSISISSKAATIYKAPLHASEEPLFLGVCSPMLIQFYQQKRTITLLRGTSFLFDNAALSAGLSGYTPATSTRHSSVGSGRHGNSSAANIDNPSAWMTVTLQFATSTEADAVAEVLLTHRAEEATKLSFTLPEVPPPSGHRRASSRHTSNTGTPTTSSINSYQRHNEFKPARSNGSTNSRNTSPGTGTTRTASNARADRSRDVASNSSGTPTSSRSSRLPSRRENDDTASTSTRSSRLPSRRENDDAASSTRYTASATMRSSQRIASRRDVEATPSARSAATSATATADSNRHRTSPRRSAHSARDGASTGSAKRRERRSVDPIEREFRGDAGARPRSHSHGAHRSRTAESAATPSSARDDRSTTASSKSSATPRRRSAARESPRDGDDTYLSYSNSVTPRSVNASGRLRGEQDAFFRAILKVQHHRLHFMTYLHKEMAHQAFLAEESKLRATVAEAEATALAVAVVPTSGASARPSSSSRRASSVRRSSATRRHAAEESSRLHEIEVHLAEVEALHREAEREREAAARLRREYEYKADEINRRMTQHGVTASRDASEFDVSTGVSPHRRGSVSSVAANGQVMVVPDGAQGGRQAGALIYPGAYGGAQAGAGQLMLYSGQVGPEKPDVGLSVVDRYIFGDEWYRLYPTQEVDVRFNAQIDVCLALRMPRERVTITNLVVDQPGLRVTAEIQHDRNVLPRDVIEKRVSSSPFRFLQRMYEMRDLFDPLRTAKAPGTAYGGASGSSPQAVMRARGTTAARRPSSRNGSRGALVVRRGSRTGSRQSGRRGGRRDGYDDDSSDLTVSDMDSDDYDDYGDARSRRRALRRRQEDAARDAADRVARRQQRMKSAVRRQVRDLLDQLAEEEQYTRESIGLTEKKTRQALTQAARQHAHANLAGAIASLEEQEAIARATVEVGAVRQMQVLLGAHRRQQHLFGLLESERDRRRAIADQEKYLRQSLNQTMNPGTTHDRLAQLVRAERQQRQQLKEHEAKSRQHLRAAANTFLANAATEAAEDVIADERAARIALMSDAMNAFLETVVNAPSGRQSRRASRGFEGPASFQQLLRELQDNEAADRAQIREDEMRRRRLYTNERLVVAEALDRDRIETAELATRSAMMDQVVLQSRKVLERRINDREQIATLVNEEQFYRSAIVGDEQDEFEVIAELFASALNDLLARVAEGDTEDDMTPRRHRNNGQRTAKPFHYMTFSPEDMDYPPSAVLAIEGILGCSINKNLEVVSISSPLPKVESEELQFQSGDMILDVAGHSLHSLSHLREVLSSRTMQVQEEAREEFPDVPADQLTTNPALQKYIEVLCEHHNFLVQVLRGCDIYQIIVKS